MSSSDQGHLAGVQKAEVSHDVSREVLDAVLCWYLSWTMAYDKDVKNECREVPAQGLPDPTKPRHLTGLSKEVRIEWWAADSVVASTKMR